MRDKLNLKRTAQMKHTHLIALLVISLFATACGAAPATAETTPIPTVIADNTIIAEGKLEPIHYTELASRRSSTHRSPTIRPCSVARSTRPPPTRRRGSSSCAMAMICRCSRSATRRGSWWGPKRRRRPRCVGSPACSSQPSR